MAGGLGLLGLRGLQGAVGVQIVVNGENTAVADHATIAQLIEQLGLTGKRIAIEINQTIVPRSAHTGTVLHSGDCVEIVHAIGGG